MTSSTKNWEETFDQKFYSNEDKTCVWHRNIDLKSFISSLLSAQRKEIGEMIGTMKNTDEMLEMEGTKYTAGFEHALSALQDKIK